MSCNQPPASSSCSSRSGSPPLPMQGIATPQQKNLARVQASAPPVVTCSPSALSTQSVAPQIATIGASEHTDSSAEVLSVFECPVCLEYMLPPYLQCQSGHLVCSNCRPKLQCCPTCRGPTPSVRNLGLEKIANTVRFPCKFASSGCPLFFYHYEKVEHEELCEYRITTLQGEDIVFLATDINLPGAVDWVMMQSCFGYNFMLVLEKQEKFDHGQQVFYAVVQLIGAKKEADNFMYRLVERISFKPVTYECHWLDQEFIILKNLNFRCYYFNTNVTSFHEADRSCAQLGYSLAFIDNAFVNTFLQQHFEQTYTSYWIGLTSENGLQWAWDDGEILTYTNWAPGEPRSGFYCAAENVHDGSWITVDFSVKLPSVCMRPNDFPSTNSSRTSTLKSQQTTASTPGTRCPTNWFYYNTTGECYSFYYWSDTNNHKWEEAEKACLKRNAHMLSIHSEIEQNVALDMWKNHWLIESTHFGIGLEYIKKKKQWKWSDGSSYDYQGWLPDEPNVRKGMDLCAAGSFFIIIQFK
uniref:E3 ubiquitin-protein ligase n=1 Tax=Heterorhabditis bacteriophora TaxID=37862 RepID=A0A1I7XI11_HETBA